MKWDGNVLKLPHRCSPKLYKHYYILKSKTPKSKWFNVKNKYKWSKNVWRKILLVSSDGPTAQAWCETTPCPSAATATADNCCVHHVNVHSCPKAKTSFCGPWIPHDGQVFTHSEVLVGPVQTGNWTSYVPGFYESGLTSLIAHFKVADMHYALETEINVVPKSGE